MGAFEWFWIALGVILAITGSAIAVGAWTGERPGALVATGCLVALTGVLHVANTAYRLRRESQRRRAVT